MEVYSLQMKIVSLAIETICWALLLDFLRGKLSQQEEGDEVVYEVRFDYGVVR
jgi:hypothetical protein